VVTSVSCAWGLEEWVDNVVISVRLGQLCWPREVGLFVWCVCVCVLGGGGLPQGLSKCAGWCVAGGCTFGGEGGRGKNSRGLSRSPLGN
jgi:hypothetical protein